MKLKANGEAPAWAAGKGNGGEVADAPGKPNVKAGTGEAMLESGAGGGMAPKEKGAGGAAVAGSATGGNGTGASGARSGGSVGTPNSSCSPLGEAASGRVARRTLSSATYVRYWRTSDCQAACGRSASWFCTQLDAGQD